MATAATPTRSRVDEPAPLRDETPRLTLLELVRVVGETTSDDREVVATILHMLRTGSVRLSGNFRSASLDVFRR